MNLFLSGEMALKKNIHQRYLHAGKLDVRGHEIHAIRVMQDALAGGNGLIVQHLAHHVRNGDGQVVRLGMAQADGEAGLGFTSTSKTFFPAWRRRW